MLGGCPFTYHLEGEFDTGRIMGLGQEFQDSIWDYFLEVALLVVLTGNQKTNIILEGPNPKKKTSHPFVRAKQAAECDVH